MESSKIKLVYTILKTLQYIHRFHITLCALRHLLHHHHISTEQNPCVWIVHMLSLCVFACVCAYVPVASQSPLFHKVFFITFLSNLTACISFLMWNRVPCRHGSMYYCATPIVGSGLGNCENKSSGVCMGVCEPIFQIDSLMHSTCHTYHKYK